MKTHLVIDETVVEEEDDCSNILFKGTQEECHDFVSEQNTVGLKVVPMTKEEFEMENGQNLSVSYWMYGSKA